VFFQFSSLASLSVLQKRLNISSRQVCRLSLNSKIFWKCCKFFLEKKIAFQKMSQSFSLKTKVLWQNIHFQFLRWKFLQKFSNPTNHCSIPLLVANLKSCFLPEARSEIQNFFCCTRENQVHRKLVIRELHTVSWNCALCDKDQRFIL
jgi:hypothetical protein